MIRVDLDSNDSPFDSQCNRQFYHIIDMSIDLAYELLLSHSVNYCSLAFCLIDFDTRMRQWMSAWHLKSSPSNEFVVVCLPLRGRNTHGEEAPPSCTYQSTAECFSILPPGDASDKIRSICQWVLRVMGFLSMLQLDNAYYGSEFTHIVYT